MNSIALNLRTNINNAICSQRGSSMYTSTQPTISLTLKSNLKHLNKTEKYNNFSFELCINRTNSSLTCISNEKAKTVIYFKRLIFFFFRPHANLALILNRNTPNSQQSLLKEMETYVYETRTTFLSDAAIKRYTE